MKKVQIYAPTISERLAYACNVIFVHILKCEYQLVNTLPDNLENITPIINYSHEPLKGCFQIVPAGLLIQKGISEYAIKTGEYEGNKTIFHTQTGDLPFDIFSAVFYMTSRYEEYLPFTPDIHGRFRAEESLAFKQGFHNIPIVDLWTKLLAERLNIPFPTNSYTFLLTIDVDNAWEYRNYSFFRTCLRLSKMLVTGRIKQCAKTFQILRNRKPDSWFTFDYLGEIEKKLKLPIQYFVLLGHKRPFDTAASSHKKEFVKLIHQLGTRQKIGIHPSYASNNSVNILKDEYYTLSNIIKNKIQRSRQHFLKMKFPDTFRSLMELGIRREYSMGWVSQVGFRAGIARPFPFYDLLAEKETHLMFVPFFAMDRSMKDYMKIDTQNAQAELFSLIDKVKEVQGQFCMLWHNDSISDEGEWKGWRKIVENTVNYANL